MTIFYKLISRIGQEQYGYLETQANKFANYLLVPRNILIVEKRKEAKKIEVKSSLKRIDVKTLNSYLAIPLSKVFGVSESVVEIALNEVNNSN